MNVSTADDVRKKTDSLECQDKQKVIQNKTSIIRNYIQRC